MGEFASGKVFGVSSDGYYAWSIQGDGANAVAEQTPTDHTVVEVVPGPSVVRYVESPALRRVATIALDGAML